MGFLGKERAKKHCRRFVTIDPYTAGGRPDEEEEGVGGGGGMYITVGSLNLIAALLGQNWRFPHLLSWASLPGQSSNDLI